MAQLHFDASAVTPSTSYEALPAADYEAMVTDSTMKSTKDGTGQYLELTLEIQTGQFQGRRIWDRLNLQNRNPKAVEIAQKQLSALCHATGVLQVQNSEQLHNRPIIMKLGVRNDPERGMQNEVKGYKARASAAAAPAFAAPRAAAAAPTAATPPWAAAGA